MSTLVLIGAGSASFTRGLVSDLIRTGWEIDLRLVDTDPDALAVAEGLTRKMVQAGRAKMTVRASPDRRQVLEGATVVITTIGVGGRRAWERDVFIPRRYGVYQPVGDSVMPGGTSRALRMIPAMVAIAEDALDLCPDALFFNYANPMAPVCRGVRKATGASVIGLCHGVVHVGHYLADALGVEPNRLKYSAVGVNHLTWFTEVRTDGKDAMPCLHEIAEERLSHLLSKDKIGSESVEAGRSKGTPTPEEISPFSWQLFRLFGAFPAVLDRHVTEFFPQFFRDGTYYGKRLGVDAYSFEQTIADGDRRYAEMREQALSDRPLPPDYFERTGGEHEQVTAIIESIRSDAGELYSANLPNRGQVPNLPDEAILESPALADASGLHPVAQPPLPSGIVGTLATRLAWVETVVEAALEGRREKFIQALVIDGSADSMETATALADELLAAHAEYLPQFAGKR